jgi:phenylpropionate dioxygenase-like ring-hydroxylating dioxygenase large terminal subunit
MDIKQQHNEMVGRMLDHVENGTTDQAEDTLTVPSAAYTDADIWQQEMDLIFKRLPLTVGLTNEIPEPGDFKTLTMFDKPLLITRQRDGSVRAMLNVCSHRGMMLTEEKSGNKGVFTCPYHGWSFAGDGSLRGVADAHKFGEVDKSCLGLTQLPTYERGGLIFTVLTPGLEVDFEAFLGGMIEDIEDLGFEDWYYCGQREIYGANWKVAYDGYLEGYHFAAAHPETIHPRTYSNIMDFRFHGPHTMIGFPQKTIAKLREVPPEDWWKYENDGYDFIRTIFPNVSIFVAPELTQIAQLIPGPTPGENRTILYYLDRKTPADDNARAELEKFMDWLKTVVQEEDYDVGLAVQKGLESGAHQNVVFGRNEHGNQYFHQWVNYYLAEDPEAPPPKP